MISRLLIKQNDQLILNKLETVIRKMKKRKEKKEMIEEKINLNMVALTTNKKFNKMMKMNGIKSKKKIENVGHLRKIILGKVMRNNKNSPTEEEEEEEDFTEGDKEVLEIEEEEKGKQTMITFLK